MTQSTLSAGLKELEAVLDMNLVERTRRVVVFTPVGVGVVRRAQELLVRAREIAHLEVASLAGALRLSVIPTIAPFLLSRILTGVCRLHPELELQVHEETSPEGCAGLSSGTRDCTLLALPYDCGEFEYATIFEDPIVVAARFDDPLAGPAQINPQDLPDDRLLFLQDGHCLRDHALKACRRPDPRSNSPSGASIYTLIQLVDAGRGVALVPQLAVECGILTGTDVVTRPLAGQEAQRVVAMAWRRHSPRAEGYARLALSIRQICVEKGLAKAV